MGDQPITRAEFGSLNAAAKALLDQLTALTAKIDNINNNNRNYNNKNNQNMRCEPIRVHEGNNRIINDSSFSKMKEVAVVTKINENNKNSDDTSQFTQVRSVCASPAFSLSEPCFSDGLTYKSDFYSSTTSLSSIYGITDNSAPSSPYINSDIRSNIKTSRFEKEYKKELSSNRSNIPPEVSLSEECEEEVHDIVEVSQPSSVSTAILIESILLGIENSQGDSQQSRIPAKHVEDNEIVEDSEESFSCKQQTPRSNFRFTRQEIANTLPIGTTFYSKQQLGEFC
uniref:Uncharacterized protein n=1 Tax=Medicago truncatula TaxID=3880 RepID=A2Q2G8_MEDTR|nr:hypothetical protein MtrDRAFT_AC150800g13v2 [Medicago truncatula]